MAERYWFGDADEPLKRVLRNMRRFNGPNAGTIGGDITTNELFFMDFPAELDADDESQLRKNNRAHGYEFRRQETI